MAKDAKTKARARVLHEAGQSLREVAQAVGVSFTAVKLWAKNEGWVKGKSAPKIAQKEEAALEAEAERHGVTKGRILAKVAELLDAKSIAATTTQGAISLCPVPPSLKAKYGDTAEVAGISAPVVPDRATQIAAAKMGIDVLGLKKVQVEAGDDIRNLFRSMRAA